MYREVTRTSPPAPSSPMPTPQTTLVQKQHQEMELAQSKEFIRVSPVIRALTRASVCMWSSAHLCHVHNLAKPPPRSRHSAESSQKTVSCDPVRAAPTLPHPVANPGSH